MMLRVYRTETLKRHLPFSGEEGLREIKKIAIRFEEKTFASAISQVHPSLKLLLIFLHFELFLSHDSVLH